MCGHPIFAFTSHRTTAFQGEDVLDPGHPRVNEVNARRKPAATHRQRSEERNVELEANCQPENHETNVQNREKADMAKNNGYLTKGEQKGINRQQNRISKSIAKDKESNK
jgi:hypothetical protein